MTTPIEAATAVLEEHLPSLGGHPAESGMTAVAMIRAFLEASELWEYTCNTHPQEPLLCYTRKVSP